MTLSDLISKLSMGAPCCVEIDKGDKLKTVCEWEMFSKYVEMALEKYMECPVSFIYIQNCVLCIQIIDV